MSSIGQWFVRKLCFNILIGLQYERPKLKGQPLKNCLSSCQEFLLLNQIPSCICSMCLHYIGKDQIAPSKAMVGVDRPMKALSMQI